MGMNTIQILCLLTLICYSRSEEKFVVDQDQSLLSDLG